MFRGEALWVMVGFVFHKARCKVTGEADIKRSSLLRAETIYGAKAHWGMLAILMSASRGPFHHVIARLDRVIHRTTFYALKDYSMDYRLRGNDERGERTLTLT